MRTSDPAAAVLRIAELPAVALAVAPAPDVEGADGSADPLNLATGALYARVPDDRGRWLSLVVDDEPLPESVTATADHAAPTVDRAEDLSPLAAPIEAVVGGLFDTPAGVVALLDAANEQRRVVDLLWAAYQIGAVQLPAALADRIERARRSWPDALAASTLAMLPS